jgi:TorA maturation chaperone TorD
LSDDIVTSRDFLTLATKRSETYGFLASVFLEMPSKGALKRLIAGIPSADPLAGTEPMDLQGEVAKAFDSLRKYLVENRDKALDTWARDLNIERTLLVRGLKKGVGPAPPYESVYLGSGQLRREPALALLKLHDAAGAALSAEGKQQPDYIGTELDFMRFLCEKEAAFWDKGDIPGATRTLEMERKLLADHLVAWVPKYCDAALGYARSGFFKSILAITRGTVALEASLVGELIGTAETLS